MNIDRKIKVCIISNIKSAHIHRWAGILSKKGYKTVVITNEHDEVKIDGVKVVDCLSKKHRFYILEMVHELIRAFSIRRTLADIKPDIVHVHSFDYIHPLMIALVNRVLNGFPNLIVSTWGTDVVSVPGIPISWRGRLSQRLLLKQAKKITATTNFLAKETAKLAPPDKKIHVIPFGIDCDLFRRKEDQKEKSSIHLGYIKHLAPKYGPDDLIKALAIIAKSFPDIHLTMAGQGNMELELKSMAANLGVEKNITFPGYIPYDKVPEAFSNMDIFVMPSLSETFGVAAVEAQAMEIPVVATNIGGIPEAVSDGETGILVEAGKPEKLADAIMRLIKDPDERERMGKAGRRFVLDNFNIADNVVLVENLYKELMN